MVYNSPILDSSSNLFIRKIKKEKSTTKRMNDIKIMTADLLFLLVFHTAAVKLLLTVNRSFTTVASLKILSPFPQAETRDVSSREFGRVFSLSCSRV